jgi:hypothetical protein
LLHLALFGVSLLLLPLSLHVAAFDAHAHPQLWLVVTLLQSVGVPYILLSSSSPMLQRWAADTSHALAKNPYPLYAASNAGSFAGLLAYPLVVEPAFDTTQQFGILTAGYLSLIAAFLYCVVVMRRYDRKLVVTPLAIRQAFGKAHLFRWLAYSAIAASLLFGTTTFITTDIASVPLLWIIPLMLYIASFIVAFSAGDWNTRILIRLYFPLGLSTLFYVCFMPLANRLGITSGIAVMLVLSALFVGALLFHRRLYELRPKGENSGLFYVILALGGALGGCFNTFAAPQIFTTAVEFPLVLSLSLLVILLPDFLSTNLLRAKRFPKFAAFLLLLLLFGTALYVSSAHHLFAGWRLAVSGLLLGAIVFAGLLLLDWFYRTLPRVALAALISGLLGGYQATAHDGSWIHAERNFFGISRVRDELEHDRRMYSHGVTMHGWQSMEEQHRLDPSTTYYGPVRDVVARLPASVAEAPIAAVGLGIGTVACYAKRAQEMDFYEIDPASIHIAGEPAFFTYLRDCPGKRRIILGDGRITLSKAPDGRYGFIIMDAFTSDAIPMHLLTLEALRMYGEKLRPDGLIAFNISNNYLNLTPVFRTLATELGWTGRYRRNVARKNSLELSSIWIVLAKDEKSLEPLEHLPQWQSLPPEEGERYRWTDNYTNLLSVLRFSRGPEFGD